MINFYDATTYFYKIGTAFLILIATYISNEEFDYFYECVCDLNKTSLSYVLTCFFSNECP